jgi:hypothetical protein
MKNGIHSRATRQRMSKAHRARRAAFSKKACTMCGSLKHTLQQHKERAAVARRKSKLWRTAVIAAAKKAHTGTRASKETRKKMSATHLVVQNSLRMLNARRTHGESGRNTTVEYAAWHSMRIRCENPNFIGWKHYGGRGIRVCKRWRNSYEKFLKDVGRRPSAAHSLDRYPNPDGNYEPGNVRWATAKQQRFNRSQPARRKQAV